MPSRQDEFRRRLEALGFDDVRFASVPGPENASSAAGPALSDWLAAGMHGDMQWLERTAARRLNPDLVLPGAKSVVMLGVNYWSDGSDGRGAAPMPRPSGTGGEGAAAGPKATWARYALHADYHDTIKPALVAAGRALEEIFGTAAHDYRYYVDTGPVLERGWAARAGLGFVGKNAMLISRRHGNWLLLAAILIRIDFVPDEPVRKRSGGREVGLYCGKCTRCLDACPTAAFAAPGVVDARRCISYQTIENKGGIPRELREGIGHRIYGCDVCLEVCPWNRFAREGRRLLVSVRRDLADLSCRELLEFTPERFARVFRGTPIKRLTLTRLLRNACIVAGNSGNAALLAPLVRLATTHPSPLVRTHAVWAVFRLGGGTLPVGAQARETDPVVLAEYAASQSADSTRPIG